MSSDKHNFFLKMEVTVIQILKIPSNLQIKNYKQIWTILVSIDLNQSLFSLILEKRQFTQALLLLLFVETCVLGFTLFEKFLLRPMCKQ